MLRTGRAVLLNGNASGLTTGECLAEVALLRCWRWICSARAQELQLQERFRVLIAEDDELTRRQLEALLCTISEVETVKDGAEAYDAISRKLPDLLLTDVVMPKMSGYELLATLRREARTAALPVVLLSVMGSEDDRVEGVTAGADDYITKPFSNRELVARIRTQLLLASQRRTIEEQRATQRMQEQLERKVRASEERIFSALANLPDSLTVYDQQKRVVYSNRAGLAERDLHEMLPGARAQDERLQKVLETGEPIIFEHETTQPRGVRITSKLTLVPLFGEHATVDQVLAIAQDVSAERDLIDKLRATDQRRSDFIGVLSHELRNPLAAIRSALYLMEHSESGTDQAQQAQAIIGRQVGLLARMIDDLLDVTRVEQNKIQLRLTQFDLNALVRRSLDDHSHQAEAGGVDIIAQLANEPIVVHADEARIQQVILSLIWNAIKFTPAGGRVTVSTEASSTQAVLRIRDTGLGIEADVLDKLFIPFVQADRTLARTKGGLGLGLALAKGLLDLHGGTVAASSSGKGQGAELTVTLPRVASAVLEAPAAAAIAPRAARRILLIDDDPDVLTALAAALRMDGHQVTVADDGPSGIAAARAAPPDVVLCDIGLPGMNGYEVAKKLRSEPWSRSLPLIALSGYGRPEDVAAAHAAGFSLHLTKPFDPAQIERAISEASRAALASRTILLVDDEPTVRLALGDALRDEGYEVLVAGTTSAALALDAEHDGVIDLLLSDLSLPEIGGEKLASTMRERHPHLRVIFMSGSPKGPPGAAFIEKPFDIDTLIRFVETTLQVT